MFFSAELLSKRDSGFGLLWLAATLGSKSSFKKLPRRSIQTADIPQLCNLISHPSEPLALRLSSNLMVGVARVYKIKHEIFMTDVNNCFILLRKAVQEIHTLTAITEAQLQMGQPTARRDALTLTVDPTVAVAFDLDIFDATWDELVGMGTQRQNELAEDDDEFIPNGKRAKSKTKPKQSLLSSEAGRAAPHTLDESHEFLLSTSFEGNHSFFGGMDLTSPQYDGGAHFGSYAFDDNLFGAGEQLDLGLNDIGDDLARELGEGWGAPTQPAVEPSAAMDIDQPFNVFANEDMHFDGLEVLNGMDQQSVVNSIRKAPANRKRNRAELDKENMPPESIHDGDSILQSNLVSADRQSLDQSIEGDRSHANHMGEVDPSHNGAKKVKKVRLQLDVRTELTDEELKAARENYSEQQRNVRYETERRRYEREGEKYLEDIIWSAPNGLMAPALVNFWSDMFKSKIGSTRTYPYEDEDPVPKRRRIGHASPASQTSDKRQHATNDIFAGAGDYDFGLAQADYDAPFFPDDAIRLRSSEEPERGRNIAPLASADLGFDIDAFNPSSGTQRSAFFPWDNAAGFATSSSAGAGFAPIGDKGSDRLSLDKADVRLERSRSHSGSRRDSFSIVPSQVGSLNGINFGLSSGHSSGQDFRFDLPNEKNAQETQETENNIVTLERTSFNFLEYCKIQLQASPSINNTLSFSDIVPPITSSRRVAASAFHHCLALATKDLITVHQNGAYGLLTMKIK